MPLHRGIGQAQCLTNKDMSAKVLDMKERVLITKIIKLFDEVIEKLSHTISILQWDMI